MVWALLNVLHQVPGEVGIEAFRVRLGSVRDEPPSPVIHARVPVLHQDREALASSSRCRPALFAELLSEHGRMCASDELAIRILEDLHGVVALAT